ncbi:MAG TPA: type II CAAX endopeptidase family protein [Anaerolineales bacterium]|nr:type II CAAX endopeptidase family protein [Anaerolineales bacterium]
MNTTTNFLKRHSLSIGILLMFAFTWPIDLAYAGKLPFEVPFIVYLFLGWGFIAASVLMTGLTLGKDAVIALLKRYLYWRVGWKWFLVAFLLQPLLMVLGVYGNVLVSGVAPDYSEIIAYQIFGESATLWLFIVPFFLIDFIANGEEIGWRGYALPRLQARHSALIATLTLGLIWGVWHLPKFLSHWNAVSFAWFMAHTMAVAFLYTWIYNGTRGSLLLVTILHASSNTAGVFLPIANTVSSQNMGAYIGYVLFEWLAALVIVLATGAANLSRTEEKQIQEEPDGQAEVILQQA